MGLLFFFFVVAVLAAAGKRRIHPLNYFFFGCAFFAFHLLFAYLVDHVAIVPAFALSSLVSLALVVSYARLFVGWRFALGEMAAAQLIYLVLFSFTFFWTGFTGLAITTGAILTLFVIMQLTGRVTWEEGGRLRDRVRLIRLHARRQVEQHEGERLLLIGQRRRLARAREGRLSGWLSASAVTWKSLNTARPQYCGTPMSSGGASSGVLNVMCMTPGPALTLAAPIGGVSKL